MKTILSDRAYEILKWLCVICLPAISTCYFALAGIWGFPYAEQIVGTISAITTFIGVLIGVSTIQYNKNKTTIKDIEDDLK